MAMDSSLVDLSMSALEDDSTQISATEDAELGIDDDNTQFSTASSNGESSRKSRTFGTRPLPVEMVHVQIHPAQLLEYEWPIKSGQKFFVQEQIAEFLGVTSFKRKYPDLSRRPMEPEERKYVIEELKLDDSLPMHLTNNMTVLEAPEVHQLMASQCPEAYNEYKKVVAERVKQELVERQQEIAELAKDTTKLAELRKRALESCSKFSAELNTRRRARPCMYDHHTSLIMYPANKFKKLKPEYTKPLAYPVALVSGQHSEFHIRYAPEELNKLPLSTVLDTEYLYDRNRPPPSPPSTYTTDDDVKNIANAQKAAEKRQSIIATSTLTTITESPTSRTIARASSTRRQSNSHGTTVSSACHVCSRADNVYTLVQCKSCYNYAHTACIDMPASMASAVRLYDWNCMDCKTCTVCTKPDDEASLMCCDKCDRGYHTFCVGLDKPPSGAWICTKFCNQPGSGRR